MPTWLQNLFERKRTAGNAEPIPERLWTPTLQQFPFLARRPVAEQAQLRDLTGKFLKQKQFSGAHGLKVTDEMAVAIAAQACLPVLHLGLRFYDDFRGIVVHPGAMLARREVTDDMKSLCRLPRVRYCAG